MKKITAVALTIQDIIAQPPTEAAHIVAAVSEAEVAASAEAAVEAAAAQGKFGIATKKGGAR